MLQTSIAIDSDGPLSLAVDEDFSPITTNSQLTYTLTYGNRALSSSITGTTLSFPGASKHHLRVRHRRRYALRWSGDLEPGQPAVHPVGAAQQVVVTVNNGLVAGTPLRRERGGHQRPEQQPGVHGGGASDWGGCPRRDGAAAGAGH